MLHGLSGRLCARGSLDEKAQPLLDPINSEQKTSISGKPSDATPLLHTAADSHETRADGDAAHAHANGQTSDGQKPAAHEPQTPVQWEFTMVCFCFIFMPLMIFCLWSTADGDVQTAQLLDSQFYQCLAHGRFVRSYVFDGVHRVRVGALTVLNNITQIVEAAGGNEVLYTRVHKQHIFNATHTGRSDSVRFHFQHRQLLRSAPLLSDFVYRDVHRPNVCWISV